jgi:hypothetical protein
VSRCPRTHSRRRPQLSRGWCDCRFSTDGHGRATSGASWLDARRRVGGRVSVGPRQRPIQPGQALLRCCERGSKLGIPRLQDLDQHALHPGQHGKVMIRRHGGHSQRSSRSQIQSACEHPSRSATVTRARSAWAKEPGRRGLRARIVLACAEPGSSGQQVADMLGTTKVTAGPAWRRAGLVAAWQARAETAAVAVQGGGRQVRVWGRRSLLRSGRARRRLIGPLGHVFSYSTRPPRATRSGLGPRP